MKIGIDLTSLQGPHRMRGIGYTLINLINNMPDDERKKHMFRFYLYPENEDVALSLLHLDGMNYEIQPIQDRVNINKHLPGKLQYIIRALNQFIALRDLYMGDSRIKSVDGIDVFLQSDPERPLPRSHKIRKALVLYDLIPYVLEWDYLMTYRTARMKGHSRFRAIHSQIHRRAYLRKNKVNCRRADTLLAISEATRDDFIKYLHLSPKKITVTFLGANKQSEPVTQRTPKHRYEPSSWGYIKRQHTFDQHTPYILFVGGADPRRKLQDLISAFNQLRGMGCPLKFVVAGDTMQGPNNISNLDIQNSFNYSSYLNDIIFLGFIEDAERDWLYRHALAYVYPSRYEGFGLPVLEAFSFGTTVIAYDNKAVREVAKDLPIYANDATGILHAIQSLLHNQRGPKNQDKTARMQEQAALFTWDKTARRILEAISK